MFDLHRVRASWQRESAAVDAVIQELDQAAWVPQIETAGDALRALIIHTRSHRVELEQGWETMNDK